MSRSLNTWGLCKLNQAQMGQNFVGKWRVGEVLRGNLNIRGLQLECATALVPALMYGGEDVVWREEDKSKDSGLYRWGTLEIYYV